MPDLRFTPPNKLRIADRSSGLKSESVRSYNERLILSLLLQHDGLSRLELCQTTGLSGQSVSVLLRSLENEGLVRKKQVARERGRLGPPTLPAELNPEGAFSLGIGVSNSGAHLLLITLSGTILYYQRRPIVSASDINQTLILEWLDDLMDQLPEGMDERLAGIGLATPPTDKEGAGEFGVMDQNLRQIIEQTYNTTVYVQHDIDAAAAAESMYGAAKPLTNYLFIFLDGDLHGRLILDHRVHTGSTIDRLGAGLKALEERVDPSLRNPDGSWLEAPGDEIISNTEFMHWRDDVAGNIAETAKSLTRFLTLDHIVLSSSAPLWLRDEIINELEKNVSGIKLNAGQIDVSAVGFGAACLPMAARFMVD